MQRKNSGISSWPKDLLKFKEFIATMTSLTRGGSKKIDGATRLERNLLNNSSSLVPNSLANFSPIFDYLVSLNSYTLRKWAVFGRFSWE